LQTVGGVGSHVAVGVTGGDVLVRGGSPVVKGPGIGPSKAFWALFAVEGPSAGPSTTTASPLIAICFRGDAGSEVQVRANRGSVGRCRRCAGRLVLRTT